LFLAVADISVIVVGVIVVVVVVIVVVIVGVAVDFRRDWLLDCLFRVRKRKLFQYGVFFCTFE